MAPQSHAEKDHPESADELLRSFAREGWRGGALRAQLADRFPDRPPDDIEDAVQGACADFLAEGSGVTEPRAVYAWIRTAAHHALLHELRRRRRAISVDPDEGPLAEATARGRGPVEELIAREDDSDLEALAREVVSSLSGTRRDILSLWAAGRRRAEIAAELGVGEKVVKRSLEEIMREARSALAGRAGEGCEEGGRIVMRLICGLASAAEAARARAHLDSCGSCSAFARSLEAWREKAGAILPLPAGVVEAASPGLLGHAAAKAGEALASARRHLLGGGAHVGGRAVAGVGPTGDPTPLAGVRPGAVAAVVAGCLAVGGGATYCARQGVDPLGVANGLIAGAEEPAEGKPEERTPEPELPATPVYEPAGGEAPAYEPEEAATPPESSAATEATPSPEPQPEPEPEPEPVEEVTPPPEQSFEPASPEYPATEAADAAPEASAPEQAGSGSSGAAVARPVPANEAPQFGGP